MQTFYGHECYFQFSTLLIQHIAIFFNRYIWIYVFEYVNTLIVLSIITIVTNPLCSAEHLAEINKIWLGIINFMWQLVAEQYKNIGIC